MKKYVYKPYNEIFPKLFEAEKKRIEAILGTNAQIEHIGSTAVPGLGGKNIIDIGIAVKKEEQQIASKLLQDLGYEFRPSFSTPDRLYFIFDLPDPEEEIRRYHIHLTYPENPEWCAFISFRDYLRKHPDALSEYADVKRRAAQEAGDEGSQYRKLKAPIIRQLMKNLSLSGRERN